MLAIQRRYAEAGSDCILTNTFGGSRIMLNRHGNADDVAAINAAGVAIAREAFGGRDGYVIGDIGPFGGLMEPYGDFTEEQVRDAFREQAKALVDAGADAIIIETQTSLEELRLGIEAAKEAGAACVIGSMAYDVTLDGSTFRTMMGIDPERAAEFMQEHGADIVALNCGTGMDMERARAGGAALSSASPDLPVMAQPNAGQPKLMNMKVVYDETPEQMVQGRRPAARSRREHHRRLLRQHARPHPRVPQAMDAVPARAKAHDMKTKLCDVNAAARGQTSAADRRQVRHRRALRRRVPQTDERQARRTARRSSASAAA